ncbi:hypothetical protein SGUI_2272 [Serinicoccus hydrothermalis]|uniref:Uncharacterized protein n=1 Tax=Serinicoccus hydrothermalis TaxID=1758689 RepID=A0A1B1NDZ5_9MICO|nr:hypothetical protein [Serinicoccus hydrothermalis]ANS79668.1 hypothetical protein SGUI_2272 [Serinicoccus hydrothermalis]
MSTTTLRTLTIAAGAGLALALANPAAAVDEDNLDGYDNVSCDVMAMPGTATATYLDEGVHGPYLDGDNEWVALTLTSDDGEVEVDNPVYGETYTSEGGAIIREITLCQGTAAAAEDEEAPAPEEDQAAQDDQADAQDDANDDADGGSTEDDGSAQDDGSDEETAGPAVETAGPVSEAGVSPLLVGGAVLAVAGAGAAAVGVRRRGSQQG